MVDELRVRSGQEAVNQACVSGISVTLVRPSLPPVAAEAVLPAQKGICRIEKGFAVSEPVEDSVLRNFRITGVDGKGYGPDDRLFESDFDKLLKELPPGGDKP
jgi:hypothetical protein